MGFDYLIHYSALGQTVCKQVDIGMHNSISVYANITMQRLSSNVCNIHIQFGVEIINRESDSGFIFNMQTLREALGLTSLTFNRDSTRIFMINKNYPKNEGAVRCGYSITPDGQIGRFYKYDSDEGWGPFTVKGLIEVGFLDLEGLYELDIFGATYS